MAGIRNKIRAVCLMFCRIGCLVLGVMMLLMVTDITLRYLLNKPIMGSYEIVEILMMILVVVGFAQTQMKDGHIRVTLFIDHMPARVKTLVDALGLVVAAVAILLVAYAGVLQAKITTAQLLTTTVLLIPLYPFYYILSIGYFVFAMVLLFDAIWAFGLFFGLIPKETPGSATVSLH